MKTISIALALAVAGCGDHHRESPSDVPRPDQVIGGNVVPRSHVIPAGHAADVRKLFESGVMSYPIATQTAAGTQTSFVRPQPSFVGSDRFVIGVPPEFHAEIDRVIATLGSAAPAKSQTYVTTFWAIEGDVAADTQIAPELTELGPTLQGLTGLGTRHYKLVDRVTSRMLDGFKTDIKGRELEVGVSLTTDPETIQLAVELEMVQQSSTGSSKKVNTKLQVQLDKPLVLGDSAMGTGSDASGMLLYVVRTQRVE